MKLIWIMKDGSDWMHVGRSQFRVDNINRPYAPKSMLFIDLRDMPL